MEVITAEKGSAHITVAQDAMWHRGIANIESCVFDYFDAFEASIQSNNLIHVGSGIGMIQGRYFCIPKNSYDSVSIDNGSFDQKRIDLIVARWNDNNMSLVVIKGTPTTGSPSPPLPATGDLDTGAIIADMPLYEVYIDGINIESVTPVFDLIVGFGSGGTVLSVSRGGTGKSTWTTGGVLYASSNSTLSQVSNNTGAMYKTSVNGAPVFSTLPVKYGGTGQTQLWKGITFTKTNSSFGSFWGSIQLYGYLDMVYFNMGISVTSGVASGSATVGTVSTTYKPAVRTQLASSLSQGHAYIDTDGKLKLYSAISLDSGTTVYFTGWYYIGD